MKISKLTLDKIRCFDHLVIDFSNNQGSKDWIMILGDNGVGKTTILRSLAFGLTEESGASGLLDELGSDWIRYGFNKGFIKIELEPFPGCEEKAFIETHFVKDKKLKEVKVRQTVSPEMPATFNWDDLFVCAYGAGRAISLTESYQEYIITDSVYTLVRYEHPLQNPELNIRRIKSIGIDERKIFSKVERILMLPEGSISLDFSGIKVSGPWGDKMPLDALGDGYRSTLGMIIDLFGWKSLHEGAKKELKKKEFEIDRITQMTGIVLLDEIEQHLHPKWQKQIVKLLRREFPNIQFITTSHSPLCVVGTTDLTDEECSIVVLEQKEDYVEKRVTTPPRGRRVDQVLTSYMFDLYTTSDNSIKYDIARYSDLYNKDRNEKEQNEMIKIENSLTEIIGSPETELEQLVEKAVQKTLKDLTKKQLPKENEELKKPIDFEIKRQLEQLFK